MNIIDFIKKLTNRINKGSKQITDPNDKRLTFISDDQQLRLQKIREYKVWFSGDGDELCNMYLYNNIDSFNRNLIFNRNNRQYFWSQCQDVENIKRIHSGVPQAIITTLVNIVGTPEITSTNEAINEIIDDFKDKYEFKNMLNQQQLPLTLVCGYGAFKLGFEGKEIYLQYYDAENVEYITKHGKTTGIIYKDYFTNGKENYVLFDIRTNENNSLHINYKLYLLLKGNELKPVDITTLDATKDLNDIVVENYGKLFGVESKLLFDPLHNEYGKSVFCGKLDIFDDMDMTLSIAGKTVQTSLPITYIPSTSLPRVNGVPIRPSNFKATYILTEELPSGDGTMTGKKEILQPLVNIAQYHDHFIHDLNVALTGLLSPASFGVDVSKKDNAEAQREKEKVSIFTRENIEEREKRIIKSLVEQYLDMLQYLTKGSIEETDYQINVSYDDFINPTFEQIVNTIVSLSNAELISVEKAVDMLWGDDLTDEEKAKEIAKINELKKTDNLDTGAFETDEFATSDEAEGQNDPTASNIEKQLHSDNLQE